MDTDGGNLKQLTGGPGDISRESSPTVVGWFSIPALRLIEGLEGLD
jgi:hypothetical protein